MWYLCQVVIVVGMAQDATEAVIAYISPLVIMSLDSALAVQDGKGPGATNVSIRLESQPILKMLQIAQLFKVILLSSFKIFLESKIL